MFLYDHSVVQKLQKACRKFSSSVKKKTIEFGYHNTSFRRIKIWCHSSIRLSNRISQPDSTYRIYNFSKILISGYPVRSLSGVSLLSTCSSEEAKRSELNKVKRDLNHNGYSHLFIEKCESLITRSKLPEYTPEQQKMIIAPPYIKYVQNYLSHTT